MKAALACSLLMAAAAPSAPAQNQYVRDDGTAESALGFSYAQDYCWMQWFTAVGGIDTIREIRAFVPSSTPAGTPITFCVWEDPGDDGDPNDAQLVTLLHTSVIQLGPNAFASYPLPAPGVVHGVFFVGAYLTDDGGMSPAALDYSTNPHVAWFSFNPPGMFDPFNLANNFPPTHIETLGAGIHGAFMLRATGSGDTPAVYCTAKTNSLGCVPGIGSLGVPSASTGAGFHVTATGVLNRKKGLLLYGTSGRDSTPFLGGILCARSPLRRTSAQSSGGTATGVDCTGVYSFDFNAWIASGADPALFSGQVVDAQYYSRDPGFAAPDGIGLTDALEFTIGI